MPREFVVVVRVTTACPLACRHCGFSRELRFPRREVDWSLLQQLGHALADFQQRSGRPVHVSWLGGEPLVWTKLGDATRLFQKELAISLGMTTSGFPISQEKFADTDWLVDHFDQLTLSLDGNASSHDSLRQYPGLHTQLRVWVQQLVKARAGRRVKLRINTVLTRSNIDHFPDFARDMGALGIDELTFNQLGGNDRPEYFIDNSLMIHQVDRFCALLPDLRAELMQVGLRIAGQDHYLHRLRATSRGISIPVTDCHPAEDFLFVDEWGRISPCSFTSADVTVHLEAVRNGQDIMNLRRQLAEARHQRQPSICRDCPATHVHQKFELGGVAFQTE